MKANHRWPLEHRPLVWLVGRILKLLFLHLFGIFIAILIASVIGQNDIVAALWQFLSWAIPRVALLTLCLLGAIALAESYR